MLKLAITPIAAIAAAISHPVVEGRTVLYFEIIIAVGTVVTMIFGIRYKTVADQQAITIDNLEADRNTWKDVAQTRLEAIETLTDDKHNNLKAIADLKESVAQLENLPKLQLILDHMANQEKSSGARIESVITAFTDMISGHEKAAGRRHDEMMVVLESLKPTQQPTG